MDNQVKLVSLEVLSNGVGTVPANGVGTAPANGVGTGPANGLGNVPANGVGTVPANGVGGVPVKGVGGVANLNGLSGDLKSLKFTLAAMRNTGRAKDVARASKLLLHNYFFARRTRTTPVRDLGKPALDFLSLPFCQVFCN